MSVNSAIDQNYLAEVEALKQLLGQFIIRRSGASTLERKVLVEAEAVMLFERLLDLDYKLQKVNAGDYPEYDDFSDFYKTYLHLANVNLTKLRKLTETFVQHFNSQQYALTDLLGKLKRIRQKRAALALWNNEDAKFVLSEHFLNLDVLDNRYVSEDTCYVDTAQGVLTLPVREQSPLLIGNIRVGSGSNGQVGNSDVAVTTNNIDPEYAVNGDPNNWFEYERLDSGPLELSLIIELSKTDVINNLTITPLNIGQAYSYVVENVIFTTSGSTVQLKDLLGEADVDRMTIKSAGNDSEWSLTFLPVQAKTITIRLKQNYAHQVAVASDNGNNTNRNRYAIGISRLGVNRIRYGGTGGINSTERDIRQGLYISIPVVDVWPPAPEFFDALMEVSFDGGETWIQAENVDDGIGSSIVMEGTETTMLWRLALSRDDNALDNATSFIPVESGIREVDFFMKPVSRFKSPTTFSLPERPARGDIFVLQPRVARRGNRFKRVLIGAGTGISSSFELPFSPVEDGLDPETMHVYVNGIEYAYQEDDEALTTEEWAFSDDFSEIYFADDPTAAPWANGSKIAIVFDEERMLFEERSDGFYHQMGLLFDPDKDNINIKYHPRKSARRTMLLPRDKKVIDLGVKNIEDDFVLSSKNGITYIAVSTRADLLVTSNGYLLDGVNGVLRLNSELDGDTVRAVFAHQSGVELSQKDFDVVYDEKTVRPWGVRIASEAFRAKEVTDTVGGSLAKRINPLTGVFEARAAKISSATDAMTLTYDYVVRGSLRVGNDLFDQTYVTDSPEEVEFVDGKTEFLGLVTMDKESTVTTEADGISTVVNFKLAAGGLWYQGFDVLFGDTSVFANSKSSTGAVTGVGDYHVADDGTVTVFVGTGGTLEGAISIYYYYEDPEFEAQNKYSVDYRNGVLYGGSDLQTDTAVTYKASSHKVAYNIAKEIDRYKYNKGTNSVQVRTEGLRGVNNLIKIIWAKQTDKVSLRTLRDYFSPIFSLFAFRFT